MHASPPQVYISGALTGIPHEQQKRSFYEAIGTLCHTYNLNPYLPHLQGTDPESNPDLPPADVYNKNRTQVLASGLVIAYVGIPSLGVGAELELANQHRIPIILLSDQNRPLSRHITGMPSVLREIIFHSEEEALTDLANCLKDVLARRSFASRRRS